MNRPFQPMRRAPARAVGAQRGFSLIELLVTIAVAGILAGLAAPSFSRMLNGNRIQTTASALQGDLMYARTEAVKRGAFVSACPSTDQASCSGVNSWQGGWIVFSDANGDGTYDAAKDGPVLKVRQALKGGITIAVAPAPTLNAVIFNREGYTTNLGTGQVAFQLHTSDNYANATRCVLVNFGGSMSTVAKGSTCS